MHIANHKIHHSLVIFVLMLLGTYSYSQNNDKVVADSIFTLAEKSRYQNPQYALEKYNLCLNYFLNRRDSVKIIKIKEAQMSIYSGLAQYQQSYDIAWSIMPYVQSKRFAYQHTELLHKMTTLYMIYQQYDKARKTNAQAKKIIEENDFDDHEKVYLIGRLYLRKAWIVAEASKDYLQSEQLILKSIELSKGKEKHNIRTDYAKLQLSELYLTMYRLDDASKILKRIESKYEGSLRSIHCLIYEYLGRYYQKMNAPKKSIEYYEKSIFAIDSFTAHISNKVDILENISNIYADLGNTKKAYQYILKSKQLSDSVFSSTSNQNKKLFEIKNDYETKLRDHEAVLNNQKLAMLEQEKSLWLLKLIIAIVVLVLIGAWVSFYFKRKAQHSSLEQKLMKLKQDEILEIKNKELMSSALQLIERDSQQEEIKKTLKALDVKEENKKTIKQLIHSLSIDKSKKWKEFETHFTAVNNEFFDRLKDNYPKLTATDLKICAFIKLGFSSKDMAQIMGIGVEGINTTRSRLRKKMNLDREVVLVDFLQEQGLE